jgi:hypothetical protein
MLAFNCLFRKADRWIVPLNCHRISVEKLP